MRLSDTTKFNNTQLNLTYVICYDKVLFVLQHEEVTDIIYIIQNRRFLLYHENIFPCSDLLRYIVLRSNVCSSYCSRFGTLHINDKHFCADILCYGTVFSSSHMQISV